MGNWFFSHVPAFQWQVINAALSNAASAVQRYFGLTVARRSKALSRCHISWCHYPDVIFPGLIFVSHNLTSSLRWSRIVIWTRVIIWMRLLWLLPSLCHANLIWMWQYRRRTCLENMHKRCRGSPASSIDASPRPPEWKMWIILLVTDALMTC